MSHSLAIFLFSEIVIFMINWQLDWVESNSVCNHTRDKQIGLSLRGRPILLSLVWSQTDLDSTQSYYHYLLKNHIFTARSEDTIFMFHVWGY